MPIPDNKRHQTLSRLDSQIADLENSLFAVRQQIAGKKTSLAELLDKMSRSDIDLTGLANDTMMLNSYWASETSLMSQITALRATRVDVADSILEGQKKTA